MTLSTDIITIETHLNEAKQEIERLEKGNKSSASRGRKALQHIKNLSHELRKSITEHTKTIPVKKRVKIVEVLGTPVAMETVEPEEKSTPHPVKALAPGAVKDLAPKAKVAKKRAVSKQAK